MCTIFLLYLFILAISLCSGVVVVATIIIIKWHAHEWRLFIYLFAYVNMGKVSEGQWTVQGRPRRIGRWSVNESCGSDSCLFKYYDFFNSMIVGVNKI